MAAVEPFPFSRPLISAPDVDPVSGAGPPFFDTLAVFPFLSHVLPVLDDLREELVTCRSLRDDAAAGGFSEGAAKGETAREAARWHDWPETSLYAPEEGKVWRVVPFCYTFPAHDAGATRWVSSSCAALPRLAGTLRRIPGLRTALLSRLGPGTRLAPHSGWAELSNHVLRCHLPLLLPPRAPGSSGVVCGDEARAHEEGVFLCFDDSLVHSAFNDHATLPRVVLIIDIARPAGWAPGSATLGTSAELEGFVKYFS